MTRELETEVSIPATVLYSIADGCPEILEIWLNGFAKIIRLEDLPDKEQRSITELCRQHSAKQAKEASR